MTCLTRRVSWALAAVAVAATLVIILVLVLVSSDDTPVEAAIGPLTTVPGGHLPATVSRAREGEGASDASEATGGAALADDAGALEDLEEIRALATGMSTSADLARKGLPAISNPRRAELEETASQSIEEVIADLGNLMTIAYNSTYSGHHALRNYDLGSYRGISSFMKVLRVIEEGRADPQRVSALLRTELDLTIRLFREAGIAAHNARAAKALGGPPLDVHSDFYNTHRREEDGEKELGRLTYFGYCTLYVLADIDQLRPAELLARWVDRDRQSLVMLPGDMDIWLIDQYFKQSGVAGAAAAARHADLTADLALDGGRVARSRWNAPWSIHDNMVVARGVDVSDIPTIEVLDIPNKRLGLDEGHRMQIMYNFLEHSGYLEGRFGQWLVMYKQQSQDKAAASEPTTDTPDSDEVD